MVQAHHDSSFEISFVPVNGSGRDAREGKVDELPMLDLNSSGPLPEFLPERPLPSVPQHVETTSLAALSLPKVSGGERRGGASMWLQGDVLMCPCPDCSAPMSVRIWLMVADCWKCGTSIELSEEQEREANRLLREREEALQRQRPKSERQPREVATTGAVAGGTATATVEAKLASPAAQTKTQPRSESLVARTGERSPQQRQRENPAKRQAAPRRKAADRAIGARARVRKMAASSAVRVWISDMFGNMPAWLVSFVFHVVLLIILSLLFIVEKETEVDILLSTEVSTEQKEGGDTQAQLATDDVIFDLPVPNEDWKKDDTKREVLVKADQQARELRLDPNDPTPDLPPLAKVQNLLKSQDTVRRTFAARDPRMRVEMVTAEGGTTLTEAAVARALRFLASQQNEDGGWGLTMGRSDAAGTSLALLPFLGAGQTHQTGVYKDNVSKGLRWLIRDNQSEDGDLRGSLKRANSGMYAHGQGTIVLSEAYALTGDEQLRGPAQRAVDFIIDAQHVGGGWRYQPKQAGDTSVLGWQLMALHSAKVSGLTVPESNVELAGNYLDSVQSAAGAKYSYTRGAAPTETMSAEGLLCRMYTGWTKRNPALDEGLDDLLTHHAPNANKPNIYYWYYGTQVAHHMGGAHWDDWNTRMRDILVESQIDGGKFAGAWRPKGPHTNGKDYIYMTSLATCCLEVYYRHAPLFRQIELEEEELVRP